MWMEGSPCLCSCGGSGRAHRCRSLVPDGSDDDGGGGGGRSGGDIATDTVDGMSYHRFTETLDGALRRLQKTASPPRRADNYSLFLRGCLEFEPPADPAFWSSSSSAASTPSQSSASTASVVSESRTPEEADDSALSQLRIADAAFPKPMFDDLGNAYDFDDGCGYDCGYGYRYEHVAPDVWPGKPRAAANAAAAPLRTVSSPSVVAAGMPVGNYRRDHSRDRRVRAVSGRRSRSGSGTRAGAGAAVAPFKIPSPSSDCRVQKQTRTSRSRDTSSLKHLRILAVSC